MKKPSEVFSKTENLRTFDRLKPKIGMKKTILLGSLGLFSAVSLVSANTGTCKTKGPPAVASGLPSGWVNKGKACKKEFASCGGQCLCSTKHEDNIAKKTTTYSCVCVGPATVAILDVDGAPQLDTRLFTYSLSPNSLGAVAAAALGLQTGEDLDPSALAGLTAKVVLMLDDGSAIEAFSKPLEGDDLDLGIEIPAVDPSQVTAYTFTLGEYTEEGSMR